jgi:hypothetical protein
VTPQVFQFIGPSNDGQRHGRGTYLFFVAAVSVSVLAWQRVAQASQAKLGRGQARPQNHNKRFPQYQVTQAGTFEKIS